MSDLTKSLGGNVDEQVSAISKLLLASATSYLQGNALEVTALIQEKVISKLPAYLQTPVNLYYPAVSRLALDQIITFANQLVSGDPVKAQNQLRAAMTVEELAKEKEQLAILTEQLASDNYERQQIGKQILKTALTVSLGIILKV